MEIDTFERLVDNMLSDSSERLESEQIFMSMLQNDPEGTLRLQITTLFEYPDDKRYAILLNRSFNFVNVSYTSLLQPEEKEKLLSLILEPTRDTSTLIHIVSVLAPTPQLSEYDLPAAIDCLSLCLSKKTVRLDEIDFASIFNNFSPSPHVLRLYYTFATLTASNGNFDEWVFRTFTSLPADNLEEGLKDLLMFLERDIYSTLRKQVEPFTGYFFDLLAQQGLTERMVCYIIYLFSSLAATSPSSFLQYYEVTMNMLVTYANGIDPDDAIMPISELPAGIPASALSSISSISSLYSSNIDASNATLNTLEDLFTKSNLLPWLFLEAVDSMSQYFSLNRLFESHIEEVTRCLQDPSPAIRASVMRGLHSYWSDFYVPPSSETIFILKAALQEETSLEVIHAGIDVFYLLIELESASHLFDLICQWIPHLPRQTRKNAINCLVSLPHNQDLLSILLKISYEDYHLIIPHIPNLMEKYMNDKQFSELVAAVMSRVDIDNCSISELLEVYRVDMLCGNDVFTQLMTIISTPPVTQQIQTADYDPLNAGYRFYFPQSNTILITDENWISDTTTALEMMQKLNRRVTQDEYAHFSRTLQNLLTQPIPFTLRVTAALTHLAISKKGDVSIVNLNAFYIILLKLLSTCVREEDAHLIAISTSGHLKIMYSFNDIDWSECTDATVKIVNHCSEVIRLTREQGEQSVDDMNVDEDPFAELENALVELLFTALKPEVSGMNIYFDFLSNQVKLQAQLQGFLIYLESGISTDRVMQIFEYSLPLIFENSTAISVVKKCIETRLIPERETESAEIQIAEEEARMKRLRDQISLHY